MTIRSIGDIIRTFLVLPSLKWFGGWRTILPSLGGVGGGLFFLLASCSSEETDFLEGSGKTPLVVVSNLSAQHAASRATENKWEANDVLLARIKHVTTTGPDPLVWAADVTGTGVGPRTANFKVSALTTDHEDTANNFKDHTTTSTLTVTDAQGLFWDDFSNSASADTDLRTTGHALMAHYAYCFNGGTPDPALTADDNETTGTIGWAVNQDQSATDAFKHSDLLFAPQQTPVAYTHGTDNTINGRERVITLPFSHAMSRVTVTIILEEGYSNDNENFANTTVTLPAMTTAADITGPSATVAPKPDGENSGDKANVKDVTMLPLANDDSVENTNLQHTFTALIAPTVLKPDLRLANITDIAGNNYTLTLNDDVLTNATAPANAWSTKLAAYDASSVTPETSASYTTENGGLTLPGVNYAITVRIRKQAIQVSALVKAWDDVSAEGQGIIRFDTDVKTIVTDPSSSVTGISEHKADFDLYLKAESAGEGGSFGEKATTITWDGEKKEWIYAPAIYWQNKDDVKYFRALSPTGTSTNTVNNGTDFLWGTTSKHSGKDINDADYAYDEGAAIKPRTMNVPLIFGHPMSKLTVNLVDALAGSTVPGATLDLAKATIQMSNLSTSGSFNLHTGDITPTTPVNVKMLSEDMTSEPKRLGFYAGNDATVTSDAEKKVQLLNYIVTPQSFDSNESVVTVTLADGTRYSLPLTNCRTQTGTDSNDDPIYDNINAWDPGKHYIYTITLSKEAITLTAHVKDWIEAQGSGNATLEWD